SPPTPLNTTSVPWPVCHRRQAQDPVPPHHHPKEPPVSASALARALRAYVRHAPGSVGKARLVGSFLDEHLRTHPVRTTVRLRSGDKVGVTTSDVIQRYQYLFGEWEPNLSAFLRD